MLTENYVVNNLSYEHYHIFCRLFQMFLEHSEKKKKKKYNSDSIPKEPWGEFIPRIK